ncbi:MAG TPA: DsbA family oxidoreductase [Casimicrobiaceae bacterium]|nr:DsbA family oxidoreductase [Casimicrobiaceae bacterium]
MHPAQQSSLAIDVVSDVVCPWCYIGKRRLEAALAELRAGDPVLAVRMRWHPFQLNPELPAEGIDRAEYIRAKWGSVERAAQNYQRVGAAGTSAGLSLNFDAIKRQPNTLDAHRLIAWAQAQPDGGDRLDALVEALFAAYFVEGRWVGDRSVLAELARESGFDHDGAVRFLESAELASEVSDADLRARQMGIEGVPFFIFDGRVALSGAHEPATMLQAIAQARTAARQEIGNGQ